MNLSNFRINGVAIAAIMASVALLSASPEAMADEDESRTTGQTIDDTTINTSVKSKLASNDDVHARNINIETNKGRVALIGYVRSEAQHKSAIATAEGVDGVVEVIDALLVVKEKRSTGVTLDDQTIETKLKFSLTEGGLGQTFAVITEVRNGEVLLGGFVESSDAKDRVGEIAKHVTGVTKVHNRLAVK